MAITALVPSCRMRRAHDDVGRAALRARCINVNIELTLAVAFQAHTTRWVSKGEEPRGSSSQESGERVLGQRFEWPPRTVAGFIAFRSRQTSSRPPPPPRAWCGLLRSLWAKKNRWDKSGTPSPPALPGRARSYRHRMAAGRPLPSHTATARSAVQPGTTWHLT